MKRQDLHIHTSLCDGSNTAEEMVRSAIEKGFETIGFSAHAYTSFDSVYTLKKDGLKEYCDEISRLKEIYMGQIKVLCGIELDYYADYPDIELDYVIGSVHYVKVGERYIPVDETPKLLSSDVEKYLDGDYSILTDLYFQNVGDVVRKTGCDIIGHFDLVAKFNENNRLFDECNPRYVSAWKKAADKLICTGKVFEINTGGISRGYRTTPYPSSVMTDYIGKNGGKFVLSSDAHNVNDIGFGFNREEFRNIIISDSLF